jgi:antitoxin FitA
VQPMSTMVFRTGPLTVKSTEHALRPTSSALVGLRDHLNYAGAGSRPDLAAALPGLAIPSLRLAIECQCYHSASMANLLVRDVPEAIHATLQQRAERQGKSLQQYLAGELARLAARPTTEELLARIERRRGGRVGMKQAVEDISGERSRR